MEPARTDDDRVIYIAVRHRGDDGVFVEGGFNQAYEFLGPEKLKFVLQMAVEALIADALAMFPDDPETREIFGKHTQLGKEGLTWTDRPAEGKEIDGRKTP